MFEDKDVAADISDVIIETSRKLEASLAVLRGRTTDAEYVACRSAVARLLGGALDEVMNPICARYPELKPPGFHVFHWPGGITSATTGQGRRRR